MLIWEILFWLSCAVVAYNYAGYALLVKVLLLFRRRPAPAAPEGQPPTVSFIVAAYNEEDCIEQKALNSLAQDYPAHLLEFLFITDGSSDRTAELLRRHPGITVLHQPERRGKTAALNRAVQAARHELLIFSDANTLLNPEATRRIARHYADPRVGGVAGEKKVIAPSEGGGVGASEGLYWKYESLLKQLDSDFYSVVGAAGELFSLRRSLYEPVSDRVILDDFIISLRVAEKGYRVMYEPQAFAMELPSFSLGDEHKRKVRIAAGGFQAIGMLRALFCFWRYPRLTFLYISHRVLRWTLSPLCLMLALVASAALSLQPGAPVLYTYLFWLQLGFYGLALIGSRLEKGRGPLKLARLAYYFVFMNVSVVQGFFRYLRGRQPATWEKARRSGGKLMVEEAGGPAAANILNN